MKFEHQFYILIMNLQNPFLETPKVQQKYNKPTWISSKIEQFKSDPTEKISLGYHQTLKSPSLSPSLRAYNELPSHQHIATENPSNPYPQTPIDRTMETAVNFAACGGIRRRMVEYGGIWRHGWWGVGLLGVLLCSFEESNDKIYRKIERRGLRFL